MCFVSMSGNFQEDLDQGTMIMLMLDLNHVINHCDSTRGHKLSRHEEKRHGGDESPTSTRDGSLEREVYKKRR